MNVTGNQLNEMKRHKLQEYQKHQASKDKQKKVEDTLVSLLKGGVAEKMQSLQSARI